MIWESTSKPRLRPVEAFRLPEGNGGGVGVRDRTGLSDVVLSLSEPALHVMALMDGGNTCEQIRQKFSTDFGQTLADDTLTSMLEHLDEAHFLDGPSFENYYQSLLEEYRRKGIREMPHAEALGIVDDSGDLFNEILNEVGDVAANSRAVGLIAPHLDYPRGRPCYAAAYSSLKGRDTPDRVVILGTNHFGRSTSVVSTANDFSTPLGLTRTDVDFLEKLEARCGELRNFELDHVREHSIELQVAWLQHLFGADKFSIVAFLCPDPCGPTGTAPCDGQGVDLGEFAAALGELVAQDSQDTLIVASADLSHIGAAFGDERTLDDAFLEEVAQRDLKALGELTAGDPFAFLRCIADQDNPTRVCSAGCIFALARVLPDASATLLGYHQAVDQPSQTGVTCAAVMLA